MALRRQKRQARQLSRPRPEQRSPRSTSGGVIDQVASTIRSAISAGEPVPRTCLNFHHDRDALAEEEVSFLRYLRWRTQPPPITVFLKHLIKTLRADRSSPRPALPKDESTLTGEAAPADPHPRLIPTSKRRPGIPLRNEHPRPPPADVAASTRKRSPQRFSDTEESTMEVHAGAIRLQCARKTRRKLRNQPEDFIDLEAPATAPTGTDSSPPMTFIPIPADDTGTMHKTSRPSTDDTSGPLKGPGALIEALLQPRDDGPLDRSPMSMETVTVESPEPAAPEIPMQPPSQAGAHDDAASLVPRTAVAAALDEPANAGPTADPAPERPSGSLQGHRTRTKAKHKQTHSRPRPSKRTPGKAASSSSIRSTARRLDASVHDPDHVPDPALRPKTRSIWFVQPETDASTGQSLDNERVDAYTAALQGSLPHRPSDITLSGARPDAFSTSAAWATVLVYAPLVGTLHMQLLCSVPPALLLRLLYSPMASTGLSATATSGPMPAPATPEASQPASPPPGVERRPRPQQITLATSAAAIQNDVLQAGSRTGADCSAPDQELLLLFSSQSNPQQAARPSLPPSTTTTTTQLYDRASLEILQRTIENCHASLQRLSHLANFPLTSDSLPLVLWPPPQMCSSALGYDVLAVLSVTAAGTILRLEVLAVAILLKPSNKGQIGAAVPCIVVIALPEGGLSSERYQQVALWLRTHGQHLAITVIQETHWASDLTFKMEGWQALASPSQDRVSGILVLVNLRFFQRDQIQLTSVIEGRLVHLRLEGNPSLDVVIVYLHLYSSSKALPGAAGLEQEFQQLTRTFSLQALNTFGRAGTPAQTFLPTTGGRGTQIDFALTRQTTADGIARRTSPVWLPFIESTGLRHLPLLGSILRPALPVRARQARRLFACPCRPDFRHRHRFLQPDDVSDCLLQAWTLTAPCPTTVTPTHSPKTQLILHLWRLRRERRQRQDSSASRAWPREAELKEAAKSLKLLCAQNRQLRIQQILQEAEQEAQTLKDYFCLLYRSSLPEPHPPGHSFTPFDVEELTGVIAQLPSGKALPSWLAPAPLWSLAAAHVADVIHAALTQWLSHMTDPMPGQWPKSSLCLLAKPSKPPKCPENLRPIALLHPVSKCLAKLAAGLLRPTVQHLATRFPQFAYIGGRSVEDSIERACSHCAAVRTTLEAQKYNIHLRRQGHVTGKCKGGITLSLDLSRAFDCLPREILHKALVFAAVEPTLIDLILHIHRQATLNFTHKSHSVAVELHSGVRQGCSLSPALWSIFICYVLHLL
ncbi:Pol [Symbiodinium sp. CCMP2592]|nr:Pol [Symbiodinium sp. CCMP2592]